MAEIYKQSWLKKDWGNLIFCLYILNKEKQISILKLDENLKNGGF